MENTREEYRGYIKGHISRVQKTFFDYGKELCDAVGADHKKTGELIRLHDLSKYSQEEFDPYRARFYPTDEEKAKTGKERDKIIYEFNKAWLHHIHYNAHHPEYWILHDDGEVTVFDMPPEQIVVMLCDWESFRFLGKGGAYEYYYTKDKKEGLLSDNTRKLVEIGLEVLKHDELPLD